MDGPSGTGAAWGPRRLAWVPVVAGVLHFLGARPDLVGVFGDDTIYLGVARSLWDHGGIDVAFLPGAPQVAKYPLGWPLVLAPFVGLTGGMRTESSFWAPILLNVLLWSGVAWATAARLVPRLGGGPAAQAAVGLLLAVSTPTIELVPTLMSEPLFTALFMATLLAALDGRVALMTLAGAAAALVRSIGGPLLLVGAGVALATRRWRVAGGLATGFVLQAIVGRLTRSRLGPMDDVWRSILHYYVAYDQHVAYYTDAGGALGTRLAEVFGHNVWVGFASLGEFTMPMSFVGVQGGAEALGVGLGVAFLVLLGVVRKGTDVGIGLVLAAYVGIFLLWTWPFSTRFWVPVMPLVWAFAVIGLQRLGAVGRALVGPLVAGVLLFNLIAPSVRVRAWMEGAAEHAAEDRTLDLAVARLGARVAPGDVLVGANTAVLVGRRLERPAIELRALLPAVALYRHAMRLPVPDAELAAARPPLEALADRVGTVWFVWLPTFEQPLPQIMAPLQREGRLVPEDVGEGLTVLRLLEGEGRPAGVRPPQ